MFPIRWLTMQTNYAVVLLVREPWVERVTCTSRTAAQLSMSCFSNRQCTAVQRWNGVFCCRERRLVAVQTTHGVLLPPDMMHSCSDMSTTLMLSDARISSSLGSGSVEFASDFPAEADSDAQTLLFGSYEEEPTQVCSCF